jgi:hypothetical protein
MPVAGDIHTLNLTPWASGLARFGHAAHKNPNGLYMAKNQVRDFDGTMHRRGGQLHLNRNPVYEGQALEEHFLDTSLKAAKWSLTEGGGTIDYSRESIFRVIAPAGGANTVLTGELDDTDGDTTVRDFTEVDAVQLVLRMQVVAPGGAVNGQGHFEIDIDPGDTTWRLLIRIDTSGIYAYDSGTMLFKELTDVAIGATDELSAGHSRFYLQTPATAMHQQWLTWRWEITKSGSDYFAAIYLEEVKIFSDIPLESTPGSDGYAKFTWNTNSSGTDVDVALDNVEIDADVQEIRGLSDFVSPTEAPTQVTRIAFYAGTRVYLMSSDLFVIKCIDDGIAGNSMMDFKVFNGRLLYVTTKGMKIRRYALGDRRGSEITGSPESRLLQVHANRVFAAGLSANRSRMYWSGLLDETVWNLGAAAGTDFANAGFEDIEPDDGQWITALGPSWKRQLVIYKSRSIKRMTGTTPANFVIEPVTDSFGATSHFAIVNMLTDQLFVNEYGVNSLLTTLEYGDVEGQMVSRNIRLIWREEVNPDALGFAWMVNNKPLDRLEVFVPAFTRGQTGRAPSRIMVMQYGLEPNLWTDKRITGWAMAAIRPTGFLEQRGIVGGTDGYLNLQDQGYRADFPVWGV